MRWYQRTSDAGVEWTNEPPCYWPSKFRLLASVESDVEPREEYFDRSGAGQSSYNPAWQERR